MKQKWVRFVLSDTENWTELYHYSSQCCLITSCVTAATQTRHCSCLGEHFLILHLGVLRRRARSCILSSAEISNQCLKFIDFLFDLCLVFISFVRDQYWYCIFMYTGLEEWFLTFSWPWARAAVDLSFKIQQ